MKVANLLTLVALSAVCFVSHAETKPYWLFVKTDGDKGFITDGSIKLRAQWKYTLVALGYHEKWRNDPPVECWISGETGDCDFSKPIYEVKSEDADPTTGTERQMGEFPARVLAGDTHITSVIFPRRTMEMYEGAFRDCPNLTNVVFQSDYNLDRLYGNVFRGCTNLTSVTLDLPAWTETSYDSQSSTGMFRDCSSLRSLTLNLPKAKALGVEMFRNCKSLESLVLDMPELESIGDYAFDHCTNLSLLSLDLPKLTSIGLLAFEYCPLCRTDATKWNLPAVTNLAVEAFLAPTGSVSYTVDGVAYKDDYSGPYGTIRLPSLQAIGTQGLGRRSRVERFELGSNSLVSIADRAFQQCRAREVVIGNPTDADIAITTDAFVNEIASIEARVRFTGKAPTWDNLKNMLGQLDGVPRSKCYTIVGSTRRDPAWKTLGEPLTDEEKAFSPANTLGIFQFEKSGKTWRCAWIVDEAMPGDKLAIRPEIDVPGWGIEISAEPAADADGLVEDGATVTLTVTNAPDAIGSFFRWYGDVGDGDRFSKTVTFTARGRDVWAMPVIDRPWTYDAAAGTIDNGEWAIYVHHPSDASNGSLWIGKEDHDSSAWGDAIARAGTGILNLNGKITDGNGKEWEIRRIAYAAALTGSDDPAKCAHAIVMPRRLTFVDNVKYFDANNSIMSTPYTCYAGLRTLIADFVNRDSSCVLANGSVFPTGFVYGQKFLRNLVVRMPKVQTVHESALGGKDDLTPSNSFRGRSLTELLSLDTDAGDWLLPDVTTVEAGAFRHCGGLRGTLALPKVTSVADRVFEDCWAIQGVTLGTKPSQTATIGATAFRFCESLKDLELTVEPTLTVAADAFVDCAPTNVVLARLAPSASALANILVDVKPATGDKACCVWGSTRVKDTTYATLADTTLTAAEEAAKPAELPDETEVLGVFRVASDGTGFGRAWMMDRPCPYDQRGCLIIFR